MLHKRSKAAFDAKRSRPNVVEEEDSTEEIEDTMKGQHGPEVHYCVTISQILEVLCISKAVSLDKVETEV